MLLKTPAPPHLANQPLVDYLASRFTYHSREEWRSLCGEGRVRLNSRRVQGDEIVNAGDEVSYRPHEFLEPACNPHYEIVYEDEWFLGVNKPGRLLVHRAGKSFRSNLMYLIRHADDGPRLTEAGPVNRLDRETSGVMLVAKNSEALRLAHQEFVQRRVRKEYAAVVRGVPPRKGALIDRPIGKAHGSRIGYKHWVDQPNGKNATTRIRRVVAVDDTFSLVYLMPESGRTHQIRVHLASVGCPIVGDKLYSLPEEAYIEWRNSRGAPGELSINRHALHCVRMTFTHPFEKRELSLAAPIPQDMRELLRGMASNRFSE